MNKQYTNEDVQRLVEKCRNLTKIWEELNCPILPHSPLHREINDALAPFLPDPEEELIEAMAQAQFTVWSRSSSNTTWDNLVESSREQYRAAARATLAIVKEKGLPQ